jgi:hypothetical protein
MAVKVDHNYPSDGDLRVVDDEATPIEGVVIKIFEHTAFFAGDTDTWVADTLSDINGGWIDPAYIAEAASYVVHFEKPTMYGPEHVEITT